MDISNERYDLFAANFKDLSVPLQPFRMFSSREFAPVQMGRVEGLFRQGVRNPLKRTLIDVEILLEEL
jgi:hypothetical protein